MDSQGHGTPENGKRDPYKKPISLGIRTWEWYGNSMGSWSHYWGSLKMPLTKLPHPGSSSARLWTVSPPCVESREQELPQRWWRRCGGFFLWKQRLEGVQNHIYIYIIYIYNIYIYIYVVWWVVVFFLWKSESFIPVDLCFDLSLECLLG